MQILYWKNVIANFKIKNYKQKNKSISHQIKTEISKKVGIKLEIQEDNTILQKINESLQDNDKPKSSFYSCYLSEEENNDLHINNSVRRKEIK